jgi:hypothetical protein
MGKLSRNPIMEELPTILELSESSYVHGQGSLTARAAAHVCNLFLLTILCPGVAWGGTQNVPQAIAVLNFDVLVLMPILSQ